MFQSTLAVAQTEKVLYTFPLAPDALAEGNPYAGPILGCKREPLWHLAVSGGAYNLRVRL